MKKNGGEKIKSKQIPEFLPFRDYPKLLQSGWELRGILDAIQPVGDGLVQLRIAGREMLVSDELEGKLTSLVGHFMFILRVDDGWGCAEVPE
jgi:hypothetical protein